MTVWIADAEHMGGCDAKIKALEVRIRAQHHLAALTTHVIDQSTLTNDPRNHSRYNKTTDTVVAISNLRTVNPQARSHKYNASDYDNNPPYIRVSWIGKKKETCLAS